MSSTALNLLTAFAVALKHKLRFEPYAGYEDIASLIGHLDTFAGHATNDAPEQAAVRRPGKVKATAEYLGISFATSNPRKAIKKATRPLGNLPLEILNYMAAFLDELIENGQLTVPMQQTIACKLFCLFSFLHRCAMTDHETFIDNNISALNDVLTGTERVLTTPLPIAYAIAISQITFVYVFLLPFQLYSSLKWVTIPATVAAGYIILGLLFIGREIENPFGQDVNDLPLENYCAQVASEIDTITAKRKPRSGDWIETLDNKVLWPLSQSGWNVWLNRGERNLRQALKAKTELGFEDRQPGVMGGNAGPGTAGTEKAEAKSDTTAVHSV